MRFPLGCLEVLFLGASLPVERNIHLCSPDALTQVEESTLSDNREPSALQDT